MTESNDFDLVARTTEALPPKLTKLQEDLLEKAAKECTCIHAGTKLIKACESHKKLVQYGRIMQTRRM
jgi:hypothetical protein